MHFDLALLKFTYHFAVSDGLSVEEGQEVNASIPDVNNRCRSKQDTPKDNINNTNEENVVST